MVLIDSPAQVLHNFFPFRRTSSSALRAEIALIIMHHCNLLVILGCVLCYLRKILISQPTPPHVQTDRVLSPHQVCWFVQQLPLELHHQFKQASVSYSRATIQSALLQLKVSEPM